MYVTFRSALAIKVKESPLQAMTAHGDMDARVHTFAATTLGRGRVVIPVVVTLGKAVVLYRRLSGPQDQSGHEGVKK